MNKNKIARLLSKLVFACLLLVLLSSETFARDSARRHCKLVPAEWSPSLGQVADFFDESIKAENQVSQQTMNLLSQNLVDVRDSQLFIIYIQLMQTLDKKKQNDLYEEQKRWLVKRTKSADASVSSKGGTLAPLEYNGAFNKITEERLRELQKRLQQSGSNCNW